MSMPAIDESPRFTAPELIREIQRRGGRVLRMSQVSVYCLTRDGELASWLVAMGGKRYLPAGMDFSVDGSYQRAHGIREWDVYIHTIPVRGEETVWEAAGRNRRVDLKVIE